VAQTNEGFLFIADITGYTRYLSGSELDHAQESLTALLNLLIEHTKPPLILSHLAGDAVFSYGLNADFVHGQTFVELIEDIYVAFRRAVELMVMNTTCACNACRNLALLDLKFFLHYGLFGIQELGGRHELVGSDVILLHRLLKNRVVAETGNAAYTLYTEAAISHLGLEGFAASLTRHVEVYEHLGEVVVWIQDMHLVWEEKRTLSRVQIEVDDVLMAVHTNIDVPVEWVWDALVQAEHFNVLAGGTRTEFAGRTDGRLGKQAAYMCYHGDVVFPQTILEWEPFERILVQTAVPIPVEDTFMLIEYQLESVGEATRLTQTFGKATGSREGVAIAEEMMSGMSDIAQHDIDAFGRHVQAVAASRPFGEAPSTLSPEAVASAVAERLREAVSG
jgi:uncharacterized protein YndB with AHSA1/START domain